MSKHDLLNNERGNWVTDVLRGLHVTFVYMMKARVNLHHQGQRCKYKTSVFEEAKIQAVEKQELEKDVFCVLQGEREQGNETENIVLLKYPNHTFVEYLFFT